MRGFVKEIETNMQTLLFIAVLFETQVKFKKLVKNR